MSCSSESGVDDARKSDLVIGKAQRRDSDRYNDAEYLVIDNMTAYAMYLNLRRPNRKYVTSLSWSPIGYVDVGVSQAGRSKPPKESDRAGPDKEGGSASCCDV